MASTQPFSQLTGALKVYIAPVGETVPAVNATPSGNWVELGATDGEQSIGHGGGLELFYDNDHQGPVKAVRPEEQLTIMFTLVGLTLENYGRAINTAANVTVTSSPTGKKLALERGAAPTEYAFLFKGAAMSPYGAYPGMYVIPRGVFSGEPEPTFGKDQRAGLECEVTVLADDTQSSGYQQGWLIAQTS